MNTPTCEIRLFSRLRARSNGSVHSIFLIVRHCPVLLICEAWDLVPGAYTIRLEVRGPSGQLGGGAAFPLTVEEQGDVLRVPVAVPVSVEWTAYGKWTVIAISDVAELARYDLIVKRVQQPPNG